MIERSTVELLRGIVDVVDTPTASGRGQKITHCSKCRDMMWSNLSKAGRAVHFLRLWTLDRPHLFPPDVHNHTSTKLPWVEISKDTPKFEEFYIKSATWSQESIHRYDLTVAKH